MLKYDFQDSVGYLLCTASTAMQDAVNGELARHGITFRQLQVLCWLVHEGNALPQGELACRMRIEPPTLVGILDRMEQHGWITRQSRVDDRRKKVIHLAAAEDVWATMIEAMMRVRGRATAGLSPEQIEELKALLQIVRSNLTDSESKISHPTPSDCAAQSGGSAEPLSLSTNQE